jgi:phenylalanyl-tRNA synthetase alpha chain
MQDTFYVDLSGEDGQPFCLRTHTSPMQIRYARRMPKARRAACAR